MLKKLLRRLRYWRNQAQHQSLLDEEMAFHLDALEAEWIAQGVPPQQARQRALRQFGNRTRQAEQSTETWIPAWVIDATYDARYAWRGLLRQPGFTLFAIAILSLGIGASSTVFSTLNTLAIRALPVQNPEQLIWLQNSGQEGLSGSTIQVDHIRDLAAQSRTLASLGGYMAFYGVGDAILGEATHFERFTKVPISCSFLPTLGVAPARGRNFTDQECQFGAAGTVILSHGFWTRRFAARPDIIGTNLVFDGKNVTVVGILPERFDFGAMFAPGTQVDALTPYPLSAETNHYGNSMSVVARMRPGANISAVQSEVTALVRSQGRIPNRNEFHPLVRSLIEYVGGSSRTAIWVISAAVLLVMGIVCANLASLQLARAATRHKEFAIRTSLGAGRARLIRQMLVESLLLASLGGSLGLVFAALGVHWISHLDSIRIPMLSQVRLDLSTVAFAIGIATLSALVFGLVPALGLGSNKLHETLKESTRGASTGRSHAWARNLLVIGEVAFACILLVASGLLIRSMIKLLDIHLGFNPDHAFALRLNMPRNLIEETNEILRRVREIPGVQSAGLTDSLPFGKNRSWGVANARQASRREDYSDSFVRIVTDGFFDSMGIRLLEGRDFTNRDRPETNQVVIINRTLANRYWPGQSALDKELLISGPKPWRVIGVVEDLRQMALEEASSFEFYLSMRQIPDRNGVEVVVRSSTPTANLASALKQALLPIDPSIGSSDVLEIQSMVNRAVSPRRVLLFCLSGFALFALLLASLGIYALIAYTVQQRAKEFGIRLALGASSAKLKGTILFEALKLVLAGIALGALASLPITSAMKGLLYQIEPTDPWSFLLAAATFTVVALVAGFLPARSISSIDPLQALRQDA